MFKIFNNNYFKYILSLVIFGSVGIFAKNINLPSTQIVMYRTIIATIFFCAIYLFGSKKIDKVGIKNNIYYLIPAGIFLGLGWAFLFEAYARTSVSIATLLYYFAPTIVILLAPIFLGDKLTYFKVICVSVSVIGMMLISNIDFFSIENSNLGIVFALLSALTYASITILNKKFSNIDGDSSTVIQVMIAMFVMIFYVLVVKQDVLVVPDLKSIIFTIILGIVHTGFACLIYFSSIQKLPTTSVAFLGYVDPISALIFANIFLGEQLGVVQIFGAVLILGSAILVQVKK